MLDGLGRRARELLASRRAMDLAADPRTQTVLLWLANLPRDLRDAVIRRTHRFAEYADLVTRRDLQSLHQQVRDLTRQVSHLSQQLAEERERLARAQAALEASGGGNGEPPAGAASDGPAAEGPAGTPLAGPRKVVVIRKKTDPKKKTPAEE